MAVASSNDDLSAECARLNEPFNHWIVHRTPFVTVKAAMTLDGKIATAAGESKWITGEKARAAGMRLRSGSDAILVGVNTILADDPSLTVRTVKSEDRATIAKPIRRLVLDSLARTPLDAQIVKDEQAAQTTIVVSRLAPAKRVQALTRFVKVLSAPLTKSKAAASPALDLRWLLRRLGAQEVTSLLVEGGGEVNASFLLGGFAHRIAFFYAPKILGGRNSRKAVAGAGIGRLADVIQLPDMEWRKLGPDLMLTGRLR
jgi:diaminohydroxyphosphoribosylaminopyrimidine deaminase/5-amino-6-(5-phosphoribosylamino)uracil reductase